MLKIGYLWIVVQVRITFQREVIILRGFQLYDSLFVLLVSGGRKISFLKDYLTFNYCSGQTNTMILKPKGNNWHYRGNPDNIQIRGLIPK